MTDAEKMLLKKLRVLLVEMIHLIDARLSMASAGG